MTDDTRSERLPAWVKAYARMTIAGLVLLAIALMAWRGPAILLDLSALAALCF